MSKFTFELLDGITERNDGNGDSITHKIVELKTLTAGETFNAQDAAEEVKATPNGYELLVSQVKFSRNLMRLSIRRIGELDIVGDATLRQLSARDYNLLMEKYNEFDGMQNAVMQKRLKEAESAGKP